jgi:N-acetylmuramic acid 6-phosphate etherase
MNLERLMTEKRNPDTKNIDMLSTLEIVAAIQREDEKVAAAVKMTLPDVAAAVELIVAALKRGGRLFYLGAGTSGRLGVLDAAECPPTFSTEPELVQAIIAGGNDAMFQAVEGAEDDSQQARLDLQSRGLMPQDAVVGLSASGRTPYVIGGLQYADQIGATRLAVVCVPESEMASYAQITMAALVGPEVIAGSTRMKAGTAQKMVLNMLSTATMVRLGKTYGNLMVDVRATNAKLTARVQRMVKDVTGASEPDVTAALEQAAGSAKTAIVMLLGRCSAQQAVQLLAQAHGSVRHALKQAERPRQHGLERMTDEG